MKFRKFFLFIIIFYSCNPKYKLGEIGNYQVVLENSRADFYVYMLPKKQNFDNSKYYYSYYNSKILTTKGAIAGKALHGKYKEMSFEGNLLANGEYVNGLKDGYWTFYNNQGNLTSDLTYKCGDTLTVVNFYDNNGKVTNTVLPKKRVEKENKKELRKLKRQERKSKRKSIFHKEKIDSIPTSTIDATIDSTIDSSLVK